MITIDDKTAIELNHFNALSQYQYTWIAKQFLNSPGLVLALFFGNQAGKGALAAISIILRIFGCHPVAEKNALYYECNFEHKYSPLNVNNFPQCKAAGLSTYKELEHSKYTCPQCERRLRAVVREGSHRIYRFASPILPGSEKEPGSNKSALTQKAEVSNTQYIEFMKWMPKCYIRDKKISLRDKTQNIIDPFPTGMDLIIEYVSFTQTVQRTAGHQRLGIWIDELPSAEFFQEQVPRITAVDGADIILTYTATKEVPQMFDVIWQRAKRIYHSQVIVNYARRKGEILPMIENRNNAEDDITVFHAASDDNPTLKLKRIDATLRLLYSDCEDQNVMEMRRYCIFKEISSVIYPAFNYRIHSIEHNKFFSKTGEVLIDTSQL